MPDTKIETEEAGEAGAELTIRTLITSALSQAMGKKLGVLEAVDEIMEELFLPGWHWAIREYMESKTDKTTDPQ